LIRQTKAIRALIWRTGAAQICVNKENIMANQDDIQRRFVELLATATESGKVEWARSKTEIGFVYCLAREELIVFEVRGGDGRPADATDNVTGVVGKCRNVSYLWLEPTPGLNDLLKLLRQAPVDEQKFVQFRRRAHSAPLRVLESLL
jgi:hypothetical protein